jgi:hypothetical protein
MSSSFINGKSVEKKDKQQRSSDVVALYINVYFDAIVGCKSQQKLKSLYRSGNQSISFSSEDNYNLLCSYVENPKARTEDESIKKESKDIWIDAKSYSPIKNQYIEAINNCKIRISNEVEPYINNVDYSEVYVHINLFGYNQGEVIGNIVNSIGDVDDKKLIQELNKLVDFKTFLTHSKVKYKQVDYICLLDICGEVSGHSSLSALVTTIGDYKDCTTGAINDNFYFPSKDKISVIDAVILCQYTYDKQTPGEKSIIEGIRSIIMKTTSTGTNSNRVVLKQNDENADAIANLSDQHDEFIVKDGNNLAVGITTSGNWTSVSSTEIPKGVNLKSKLSGLYSELYEKKAANGQVECYVYCTAGTEKTSFTDWVWNDIQQGLTGISLQYTQSVRNAKELDKYCRTHKVPLFFVGHSLGGGLASNNAIVTSSCHAITFNAAGLNPFRIIATLLVNTKGEFNITERSSRVHPFVIEGEFVSKLKWIGEPALGKHQTITLDKNTIRQGNQYIKVGELNTFGRHGLLNFLKLKNLEQLSITN